MSKKHHHQSTFGLNQLIRLAIFLFLCYSAITYLSPRSFAGLNIPSISSYSIPQDIPTAVNQITATVSTFVSGLPSLAAQTWINLKKELVTQVYQDIIQSIEKK
jgi:hypothetical protein